MFYCDPPGHTSEASLFNLTCDPELETDYVYFHDQEPVHLDLHEPVFASIADRTDDIWHKEAWSVRPEVFGHVVVSERGEHVEQLAQRLRCRTHYYFFHGWAALDWYRGYDRAFVIARARDRKPTRTFMSPNRIVGGRREHRILFLYWVHRLGMANNWISAPRVCSYEQTSTLTAAQKFIDRYPDIVSTLAAADLPRLFPGESTQEMTSYCLSNFDQAADSLVYVPTETVYAGRRTHLTEKTFKAIALEMPFVLVAPAGSLAYLREYGFQTFDHVWDESYDTIEDPYQRMQAVAQLLHSLHTMTPEQRQRIHEQCVSTVEHNYHHFYSGGFAQVLWQELQAMLDEF